MIPSLLVLCVAAAAMISYATSALTGLGLALVAPSHKAHCPASRARLTFALALLPAAATLAVMTAALAPLFGWIADHCAPGAAHAHPHICAHHESGTVSLPLALLAVVFVVRLAAGWLRMTAAAISASRAARQLWPASRPLAGGRARILPLREPQAFVLGVLKPAVFISEGLAFGSHRDHLDAALAHEEAHLRRADPLRRFLAGFALAFHLPGVARAIETRLARAHERAADEDAAGAIGSRLRVANALVDFARLRSGGAPSTALAFAGTDIEARVRALLDPRPVHTGPRPRTLWVAALLAACAAAASAGAVHHAVETSLGILAGSR